MNNRSVKIGKKIILPAVLALGLTFGTGALIACGDEGYSEDDIIAMDFVHAIDFYYDGGLANGSDSARVRVKDGSYVPEPSAEKSNLELPAKNGYSVRDFCHAKTDENGELVLNENGKPIADETRVFDFSTYKADSDVSLVVRWWENYTVVMYYGEEYTEQTSIGVPRNRDGSPTEISSNFFNNVSGYTILGHFYDKAETSPATVSGKLTSDLFNDELKYEIYGKSLTGKYELIRKAEDLSTFTMYNSTNLYFFNDVDLSDFYDGNQVFVFPSNYSGTIIGNNKTVTGLQAVFSPSSQNDANFGLFKEISDGAKITDITFKDVTVKLNLSNPQVQAYNVGFLAGRVRDGATLSNVKISGSIEYEVVTGYDLSRVHYGELFGEISDGASENVTDTSLISPDSMTVTSPSVVRTADNKFAVYVKVTESPTGKSLASVYGLASVDGDALSAVRLSEAIVKNEDDAYLLKSSSATYTVSVTLDEGVLSATVVQN